VNKKLLAAAVVSAFAAPVAFAQTAPANVTVYGSLQMEVFTLSADGANGNPDRSRINAVSSPGVFFIGFRGTESLGGGLSAIWQIEQGAGGDGSGTSNTWGGRNTFLGLAGGFGRVYVGIMDSPYKRVMGINNTPMMRAGLTGPQGINAIMNNGDTSGGDPFISSGAGNATAFSRRVGNSVNYDSPSFGGFSVSAQYGANEGRSVTAQPTTPGSAVDPSLYSLSGTYRGGPFAVGLGYQQHNDFRGAGLTDSSYVLSASWTSGPFQVQGSYSKFMYDTAAGDVKRDNFLIGGAYAMGNHRFRLQYQQANDTKGASIGGGSTAIGNVATFNGSGADTGAKVYSLNYGYLLSKRTEVYGFYAALDNDANGRTNLAGSAALGISGGALRGMDATIIGVGIAHSF
jgi:predicted porin